MQIWSRLMRLEFQGDGNIELFDRRIRSSSHRFRDETLQRMNDMTVDIARLTLECAELQTLNTELRSKVNQLEIGCFIRLRR
jgi:hypothetical protein